MKKSFLDYYKLILDKVSFDRHLFRKEYHKAMKRLQEAEKIQLHIWLRARGLYRHLSEGENWKMPEVHTHTVAKYDYKF